MKPKVLSIIYLFSLMLLLCSCKANPSTPAEGTVNPAKADDNQANHGLLSIMETEHGYYYNYGYTAFQIENDQINFISGNRHQLRYYDKESGESILLCNKPECEHQGGDSCVATYGNLTVINSILYNNMIYVYGMEQVENIMRFNLYQVALDGSSMDKVGTVFEAENTIGESATIVPGFLSARDVTFIIHRGYAYLPYYLRIGKASKGFMGGGLVQMNLETGKIKTLFQQEYMNSLFPQNLMACGDYVYMDMRSSNAFKGSMRYVISRDTIEYPPACQEYHPVFHAVTEEQLYVFSPGYDPTTGTASDSWVLVTYDGVTAEQLPERQITTDITGEEIENFRRFFPYKDMMIIATQQRVVFYGISEENYGQKLGEIVHTYDYKKWFYNNPTLEYHVENDTLYRITELPATAIYGDTYDSQGAYTLFQVSRCSLADIFRGQGVWTEAFVYEPGRKTDSAIHLTN